MVCCRVLWRVLQRMNQPRILTYGVSPPPLLQCDVCTALNPRAGEILDSDAGVANMGTHMDTFELANMGIVAPEDYGPMWH